MTVIRSYYSGCSISSHPVTPNARLVVDAGLVAADDNTVMLAVPGGEIDFSVSGANGLDQGSVSPDQWYHCFAIAKDDGTTAFLASTSLMSPYLPTGYTKKRRIGSRKTDANGALIKVLQFGCYQVWDVPIKDFGATNPGSGDICTPLSVPPDVVVKAAFNYYLQSTSGRRVALITSPQQPAQAPAAGTMCSIAAGMAGDTGVVCAPFEVWTDCSGRIRHRVDTSNAGLNVFIVTTGWFDPL